MSIQTQSCNCIGPQGGQPLCPCMMRGVQVVDGRYVKTQDLGPVSPAPIKRVTCDGCGGGAMADWKHCPFCGFTIKHPF